jgi:hypothetical protein
MGLVGANPQNNNIIDFIVLLIVKCITLEHRQKLTQKLLTTKQIHVIAKRAVIHLKDKILKCNTTL